MNGTLIHLEYKVCQKSTKFKALFTKIEMNEWNVIFSEYKVCQKCTKFKAVFTKIEIKNELNVIFF